jgi:hypothetical protein
VDPETKAAEDWWDPEECLDRYLTVCQLRCRGGIVPTMNAAQRQWAIYLLRSWLAPASARHIATPARIRSSTLLGLQRVTMQMGAVS